MTPEEALNLIIRLAGFKLIVTANRFGCDSDFARAAHDTVIEILDGWRKELGEYIDMHCALWRTEDSPEADEIVYEIRQLGDAYDRYWHLGDPEYVGGWHILGEDGVSPLTGEPIARDRLPMAEPIPEDMLCGLAPILFDIGVECRILILPEIVSDMVKAPEAVDLSDLDIDDDIPW